MKKSTLLIFVTLLTSMTAKADMFGTALLSVNTIYVDREYDTGGAKSKVKNTDTDIRLQKIARGWSYGLIYSQSALDSSEASRTSYGVSGGYFSERDFYITGHYFFNSKYRSSSGYIEGTGYQFDVGFLSRMNSSLYIGLGMAMKTFNYGSSSSSASSSVHREISPYFSVAINFL